MGKYTSNDKLIMKEQTPDCDQTCEVSKRVICDLNSRSQVKRIDLDRLFEVEDKDVIGYFADDSFYDELVDYDCDVYLEGTKVLTFRKSLFPKLKDKDPDAWEYFRWASRDLYSDARGLVAGKIMDTDKDIKLTNGVLNFFKRAKEGKVGSLEEAMEIVSQSPDFSRFCCRVGNIKKDFPQIAEDLKPIESELRKKKYTVEEKELKKESRGKVLQRWFPEWLENVWALSEDPQGEAKKAYTRYVSNQARANKCFSNVLGAMDRGARNPYARLSMTTKKDESAFRAHRDIYQTACAALKHSLPDRWHKLYDRFSKVVEPEYNLFGTCFTTLTLNWNFRTAFHYDANNCEGGIAVLTALTKGEYKGHYLVFPQLRLAFDLRDGDFLAGNNQELVHGNTAMIPITPDAERVSLVFYSRERMTEMESWECENCRKEFMNFAAKSLPQYGKGNGGWNGVFPGMWKSEEWAQFKKDNNLERCSNTNWWVTEN